MKRLIAGLACALMLSATACAQEYQNVSQLRESAPARWTTTIETKWRDVAIDAKIVTPNVEAIPVVKVGYDLHPSAHPQEAVCKRRYCVHRLRRLLPALAVRRMLSGS